MRPNVSEINPSILPIQFVLECEELNEKIPFCHPIRILLPPLLGGKCYAASSVIGGPAMNFTEGRLIEIQ